MHKKTKRTIFLIAAAVILIILTIIFLFPIYMMTIFASQKSPPDYLKSSPLIYSNDFLNNLNKLFYDFAFIRSIINSIAIAVLSTVAQVISCTIVGFILTKYKFKFRNALFNIIIATMMIPTFVKLIPLYQMMLFLKWINTYLPFIAVSIGNPMGIFLMKQFMERGLPDEMLDAGRIDGLSIYQILFYVVFPVLKPAVAVLATLGFITTWNDYMTALVMLPNKDAFTIPIVLQHMLLNLGSSGTHGELMMAILVTQLPIIVVFLFASKQIIGNILAGSIKS
ncbi:MAG: carbohydrate ABC transporter permease [Spirochaetales bacterium]|nr:carbohydrate ABC transporter permease [Spirochaetales bacterium]